MSFRYHRIYKYVLDYGYEYQTRVTGVLANIPPGVSGEDSWIFLAPDGLLKIRKDYSWDGASGPARDTKNFMRASLVHDALYQLMEEGQLSRKHRKKSDQTMRDICKEDGMRGFRRWYTYWGVRLGGGAHV